MVNLEKLPISLLQGKLFHCRPVEDGPIVTADVHDANGELPLTEKVVVCPERAAMSQCSQRSGELCHYWKTPHIIGPRMDEKSGD